MWKMSMVEIDAEADAHDHGRTIVSPTAVLSTQYHSLGLRYCPVFCSISWSVASLMAMKKSMKRG